MLNITDIASIAHEANRRFCEVNGDHSQPEWGSAPLWQTDSACKGVKAHLEGKLTSPADSHESWLVEKRANGWVYGEAKDVELKTHPCMVPFNDLPSEQQAKDHLFRNIVLALLPFYNND